MEHPSFSDFGKKEREKEQWTESRLGLAKGKSRFDLG